jgi:hypothetical protein
MSVEGGCRDYRDNLISRRDFIASGRGAKERLGGSQKVGGGAYRMVAAFSKLHQLVVKRDAAITGWGCSMND